MKIDDIKSGPIVGKFTTHTVERGRDKPVNMIRRLFGRLPVFHTYIDFNPKHDIEIAPGETVEFRFWENGDVELVRKIMHPPPLPDPPEPSQAIKG